MRKIILTALIMICTVFTAGHTAKLYAQQPFTRPDTISRTVSTAVFDTVTMSGGYKTIYLTNSTAGTLTVCFSYLSGGTTYRDTVNYFTVLPGLTRIFPMRDNKYMYLKSTTAGTVTGIIDYGIGESSRIDLPIDAYGNIKTGIQPVIDTLIYVDTLTAGDTLHNIDTRGYDIDLLYIQANADTTLDTVKLYTLTAEGASFQIGAKNLYGNTDVTIIANNATINPEGLAYFVFSPYPETLLIRLINSYYFTGRFVIYELHLIRKR